MTSDPRSVASFTDASDADAAPAPAPRASGRWVPIRSLGPAQVDRVRRHLKALPEADRWLRFGQAASDAQIDRYVDGIDLGHDELLGIFNFRLKLIACAHVALQPTPPGEAKAAEFGVSVLPHARRRGYGTRLFDAAVLHARNRGVEVLNVAALSDNVAMLRIAANAGASVVRSGPDSQARLRLPPETFASRWEQRVGQGAATVDYLVKAQNTALGHVGDALRPLRAQHGRTAVE